MPLPVARDGHTAEGHNDSGTAHLTEETLQPCVGVHDSTRRGYLIGVLGNYSMGLDQVIDGKGCFVRPHGEKIAHVNDGEIRSVEFTLRLPISNQTGVTRPEDGKAIRKADDVAGLASGVTRQAWRHARTSDSVKGIHVNAGSTSGMESGNRGDFHPLVLARKDGSPGPSPNGADTGGGPGNGKGIIQPGGRASRRWRPGDVSDLLSKKVWQLSTDKHSRLVYGCYLRGVALARERKRRTRRTCAVGVEHVSDVVHVRMVDQQNMRAA